MAPCLSIPDVEGSAEIVYIHIPKKIIWQRSKAPNNWSFDVVEVAWLR